MKLIAGLGNPGFKYEKNRHNLGFMVVDTFVRSHGLSWRYNTDWMCYYIKTHQSQAILGGWPSEYLLIKPATYVNKSGETIVAVGHFYKIENCDILIVHDDLDLPFGQIRLSFDSVSAGHHGVESIIESLGTFGFGRLRVGIGSPEKESESKYDATDYVLSDFSGEEQEKLPEIIKRCELAIKSYLDEGIEATMSKFN